MKSLVFYDSTSYKSIMAIYTVQTIGGSFVYKDLHGVSTSNINSYIVGITPSTYDNIFTLVTTQASGASSVLSYDQHAALNAALTSDSQGVIQVTGACASNSTVTEIVLSGSVSTTDDAYTGMYILTAGTTVVAREITGYVGSTKTATVTTTTTAVTTTETFIVLSASQYDYLFGTTTATGQQVGMNTFIGLYPNINVPSAIVYTDGVSSLIFDGGTAASVTPASTTTAVVLAASNMTGAMATPTERTTNNFFKGMWLYIYDATTGAGQYGQITGYVGSTKTATVNVAFSAISGTIAYRIVQFENQVLADASMQLYAKEYLMTFTSVVNQNNVTRLINNDGRLGKYLKGSVGQDFSYLNSILAIGRGIYDGLLTNLVSLT